jgi:type IV pilus assembly protein PilQ
METYQRLLNCVLGCAVIAVSLCACASGSAVKSDHVQPYDDSPAQEAPSVSSTVVKSLAVVEQVGSCTLSFSTGSAPQYTVFKLSDPHRIIVDMPEFSMSPDADLSIAENEYISGVVAEKIQDSDRDYLRLTVALNDDFSYQAVSDATSLALDIRRKPPVASETVGKGDAGQLQSVPVSEPQTSHRRASGPAVVSAIVPHGGPDGMTVEISSAGPIGTYRAYTLEQPNRLVIDMPGARSALDSSRIAVNNGSLQQIRIGGDPRTLRIVLDIAPGDLPPYQIAKQENSLLVHFQGGQAVDSAHMPVEEYLPERESSPAEPQVAHEPLTDIVSGDIDSPRPQSDSPTISFDFKDADIKNVLRLIADISGKNMIISENVTGRVTLKLDNIPIDEALDLILETNGLGSIVTRNITRIETRERIKTINEEKLLARKSHEEVVDLEIKTFDISYTGAQDVVTFIRQLKVLSDRGSITAFKLTNKVTVKDIPDNIPRVAALISEQDVPTRQVMIEARVVQSNPSYTKQLGISWGGTYSTTKGGDPITIGGAAGDSNAVNLPAPIGPGSGGGINLGYIKDNLTLNMQLSALENDDKIKIISNPRVIGLDNQEARIKQGVALPYAVLNENGVTSTQFKDAVLELEVTPKITPANTISLEVNITKNQKSSQTGQDNVPGIDIREVETFLLVQSGVTAVIGGIYETTKTVNIKTVPFFGTLPYLGYLFRNERYEEQLAELLVFLTVTVLESPEQLVQGTEAVSG